MHHFGMVLNCSTVILALRKMVRLALSSCFLMVEMIFWIACLYFSPNILCLLFTVILAIKLMWLLPLLALLPARTTKTEYLILQRVTHDDDSGLGAMISFLLPSLFGLETTFMC